MIADLLQGCHDLDVLEKAFGDLFALGIALEILQAQNLSLAGQRELRIEGRPIDLVAELDAGELDIIGVQAVEEALKIRFGERGIGK
jgi:hypothetical protein